MYKLIIKKNYSIYLISLLFFTWTSSFLWPTIELAWINRVSDFSWIIIVFAAFIFKPSYRFVAIKTFPIIGVFLCFMLIAFLYDVEHPEKSMIYGKTFLYIPLGIYAGMAFADHFLLDKLKSAVFLRMVGWLFAIFVISYFTYAVSLGWHLGQSLLATDFGSYYQGMSRLMAVSAIILVMTRTYLPLFLFFVPFLLCIAIIISFSGIGAIAGIVLAMIWLIWSSFVGGQIKSRKLNFLFLALFFLLIYYFISYIDLNNVLKMISSRIENKLSLYEIGYQTRPWLIKKGIELWFYDNFTSLIFGPGAMNYSHAVHYSTGYRHPHNLFVAGFVWFGLFFLPFGAIIVNLIIKSFAFLFSKSSEYSFLSIMVLNYFFLSMVGGDFEQNRHLFFMLGAVYFALTRRKSLQRIEY